MKAYLTPTLCFLIISLILTGYSSAKINPENIVAIWLFEENTGKAVVDSSVNGNDGELMNDPKWSAGGEFGRALEFDGKDDYVLVAGSPSLDITDNITITAWAKHAAAIPIVTKIFHYRRTGTGGGQAAYQFRFGPPVTGPGKKLIFQTNTAAGAWKHAYSEADVVNDTKWHHVASSASNGKVVLYLDGVVLPSKGEVAKKFDDGDQGYIGARVESNEYFSGLFDEIAIFNLVLAADDINHIMTAGLQSVLAVSPAGKLTTTWASIKALR